MLKIIDLKNKNNINYFTFNSNVVLHAYLAQNQFEKARTQNN